MLTVDIDSNSGFCAGVIKAISKAEDFLKSGRRLYSLGAIVHNDAELNRLNEKGLVTIDKEDLEEMVDARGEVLLIRAHGEPPHTYSQAEILGFKIIDCTCQVVLQLQKRIREAHQKHIAEGKGQIIIFGKIGHAEVNGLVGQVNGDAVVVDSIASLNKIDYTRPIQIFSQTTKDPKEYEEVCDAIRERIKLQGGNLENFKIHNTICRQVAQRHTNLMAFAKKHSVIVFISGKESSNGKVLYDLCKSVNPRSYHIQTIDQINPQWFTEGDSVGICGATSTPKWQLEGVAKSLGEL